MFKSAECVKLNIAPFFGILRSVEW